jgi:hypothetical protein
MWRISPAIPEFADVVCVVALVNSSRELLLRGGHKAARNATPHVRHGALVVPVRCPCGAW